ncbi:hypothetical protein [Chryseobacterium populi]|uniref:Uncharacterized protein n=1 Tax=Chryseobacterium populi TaxID=1144316 RepID=J3CHS2_9FLAO|nr:hypothetical protein [Chryseobacterium populi]EJL71879.1 hypothetical protein PMI13_02216 [Chryseobacterium populi]
MKKTLSIVATFIICLISCTQNLREKQILNSNIKKMNNSDLIENVKLAINPKFQDWVLFKNGTYIIFDNVDTIKAVNDEAIKQMKEFGPVFAGGPAGDFNTIHLTKTDGWIVSGHGYGMYTYVNPSEIENKTPNDIEIGIFGRSKRDLDGKNPEILYINSSKK